MSMLFTSFSASFLRTQYIGQSYIAEYLEIEMADKYEISGIIES